MCKPLPWISVFGLLSHYHILGVSSYITFSVSTFLSYIFKFMLKIIILACHSLLSSVMNGLHALIIKYWCAHLWVYSHISQYLTNIYIYRSIFNLKMGYVVLTGIFQMFSGRQFPKVKCCRYTRAWARRTCSLSFHNLSTFMDIASLRGFTWERANLNQ